MFSQILKGFAFQKYVIPLNFILAKVQKEMHCF